MDGLSSYKANANSPSTPPGSADGASLTVLPRPAIKRKHGNRVPRLEHGPKRQKIMGRPKNGWTPTRLRKLVRLYLMTNLEVVEIAKVLQTKDFKPCKRDVQEKLKSLLQPRPDKIRARGRATKTRLQLLRECKQLRQERQQRQRRTQNGETIERAGTGDAIGRVESPHETTISIPKNSTTDWAWLNLGHNSSSLSTNATNGDVWYSESVSVNAQINQSISPLDDHGFGIGVALPFIDPNRLEPGLDIWPGNIDPFPYLPLSDVALIDTHLSNATDLGLAQFDVNSETPIVDPQMPENPKVDMKVSPSQAGSGFSQSTPENSTPKSFVTSRTEISKRNSSIFNPSRTFSRVSVLSVSSLRKRLSLKYSESYLEDIQSLMQNLTIAGSSAISTKHRFSRAFSTLAASPYESVQPSPSVHQMPSLDASENKTPRPSKTVHPVMLPGSFPNFCWAHINNNKLRACRHGIEGSLRGPKCRPTGRETYRSMRSDVFSRILANPLSSLVINEVDTFGNSGVHIAAACKHPSNLLALQVERSWSREPNIAGQTFLHLIQEPSPSNHKDICILIQWLAEVNFDFTLRDHHGQTALHLLTRPWLHGEFMSNILEVLFASKIMIPTFRDNLGYTVKEQIEQLSHGVETVQVRRFLTEPTKSTPLDNPGLPNFGKNTAIETVEDLVTYAQHAELLKDIRHSINNPLHEDAKGRNGLHCLAEVSLNLPLPEDPVPSETQPTPGSLQTQRERYLQGLLKSGVDVNNHDKQGFTPLMVFITHSRAGEDDAMATRLLQRLSDAKAGINTRNRQGETPLHLAVKLGRRAATKFLLSHGANVHARDGDGLGVIALGERASKRAKHDEILYGQILLCISLVVSAGGVSNPTILQEWGSPQWKISD